MPTKLALEDLHVQVGWVLQLEAVVIDVQMLKLETKLCSPSANANLHKAVEGLQ